MGVDFISQPELQSSKYTALDCFAFVAVPNVYSYYTPAGSIREALCACQEEARDGGGLFANYRRDWLKWHRNLLQCVAASPAGDVASNSGDDEPPVPSAERMSICLE
jgi:hypothetical protein